MHRLCNLIKRVALLLLQFHEQPQPHRNALGLRATPRQATLISELCGFCSEFCCNLLRFNSGGERESEEGLMEGRCTCKYRFSNNDMQGGRLMPAKPSRFSNCSLLRLRLLSTYSDRVFFRSSYCISISLISRQSLTGNDDRGGNSHGTPIVITLHRY